MLRLCRIKIMRYWPNYALLTESEVKSWRLRIIITSAWVAFLINTRLLFVECYVETRQ